MCAGKKQENQFEDTKLVKELKQQIEILKRKVLQLKPELEGWIKKNFINSWKDGEEE